MKWSCYVCDPKPMANLIVHCTRIISAIEDYLQKEREKKKQREIKAAAVAAKVAKTSQAQHMPQQLSVNPGRAVVPSRSIPASTTQPPQPVLLTQVPNIKTGGFQLVSVPVGQQVGHGQRHIGKAGPVIKTPPTPVMKQQLEQKRTAPVAGQSVLRQNEFWNIPISEFNVGPVLQRVNAFTHSLFVLSGSMQKELEVADKTMDHSKARDY